MLLKMSSNVPYIGIYSFPKSGNTWIRHIVSSLYFREFDKKDLKSIPDMHQRVIADARSTRIGNRMAVKFYKSHCGEIVSQNGGQKINHHGIIYITRHPLDVFLSYLNFLRADVGGPAGARNYFLPVESVEDVVANGSIEVFLDAFILYGTLQPSFAAPKSWFENMEYWTARDVVEQGGRQVPIACLKYEDMVFNGVEAMQPLCDMLGQSKQQVREALSAAGEKTKVNGKFFWKQKPGLYRDVLPDDLIARFRKHHGDRVAALGYEI